MPTDPLQLARLGALKATDAPSQLPSGILPGTSSKGASWITSLTKPFDAYFRNYQIRQQQEFALKAQEQQGQQALQLEKAKNTKYLSCCYWACCYSSSFRGF
jgi:hypothetical protein